MDYNEIFGEDIYNDDEIINDIEQHYAKLMDIFSSKGFNKQMMLLSQKMKEFGYLFPGYINSIDQEKEVISKELLLIMGQVYAIIESFMLSDDNAYEKITEGKQDFINQGLQELGEKPDVIDLKKIDLDSLEININDLDFVTLEDFEEDNSYKELQSNRIAYLLNNS